MAAHRNPSVNTKASSRENRDVSGTSSAVEYSAIPNDEKLSNGIREPFSVNPKGIIEVNANQTDNSGQTYQPLNKFAILKQWALELLAGFISVAAFVVMVILLSAVNEKPQPPWATPTVLGALVVIASYAIGPLSQQAVKTYSCEIPAEGVARLAIAERVAPLDTSQSVGFISGEMSTTVINGLLSSLTGPLDQSQLFDCDTGNCTFASISGVTHSSVGVCSKCTDVKSELQESQDWPFPEYHFRNNSQFAINTRIEPTPLNVTTAISKITAQMRYEVIALSRSAFKLEPFMSRRLQIATLPVT
ncbi:hypothetical protein CGCSCA4_v002180 [Colletotrichum siamense]|uniref:Uncharacterized protein n=1 Tax=Colletotrichum siamense TaxID=690259 RepID=A0A9P5K987_COLSI|nr:hypothetical protein CGCSCA4_v002180 [Colletotrichum siamense]KAF4864075.1 hypothetical protein CGCSCA2_v002315 [Colletotrichum siamense]